jgi:hypothetical protein
LSDRGIEQRTYRQPVCAFSGQSFKALDKENSSRALRLELSGAR